MSRNRLTGVGVLITRPAHQAGYLAARINELSGKPWLFPVLEISDSEDRQPLLDLITRLDDFDLAVFVSPNAVERVMPLIQASRTWPRHVRVATVGTGSAQALERYGVTNVIVPGNGSDSEALLRMSQLQSMQGRHVVIFRGNGGRKLLGDTLQQRGANVEFVECYRRHKPEIDPSPLLKYWSAGGVQAVIVTSSEGLLNLFDMIGKIGEQLLKTTPMFTAHDRIAQKAGELGIIKVYRTPVGDEGTIQGLLEYFDAMMLHQNHLPT